MIDDGGWFMKSKRTFGREHKLAAVKKIVEQGIPCAEVAKDLGVKDGLLRNWRKKFEAEGVLTPAPAASADQELRRLPQPRELQDGHLLPLRRIKPLPTKTRMVLFSYPRPHVAYAFLPLSGDPSFF
jgi:transposase